MVVPWLASAIIGVVVIVTDEPPDALVGFPQSGKVASRLKVGNRDVAGRWRVGNRVRYSPRDAQGDQEN